MREGQKKAKILYLMKILLERTDENNGLTMEQIIEALDGYGIEAERKSLYADIRVLKDFGIDIQMEKHDHNGYYHVVSREFELAELKLLVDSVQSARFITRKKSNQLIGKLEGLASKNDARELQHQVFVTERVKSNNEKILYNIDAIHKAIEGNRVITFRYFKWNTHKKPEFRHGGEKYEMSPWAMTLVEENYYLLAYDSRVDMIKYFRIDKMQDIEFIDKPRAGKKSFKSFDVGEYARKRFRMYDGPESIVRLRCSDAFADVIFDRFGKDVMLHSVDNGCFAVNVSVALSRQFYAWVLAMNDNVKVAGPSAVVSEVRDFVRELGRTYQ